MWWPSGARIRQRGAGYEGCAVNAIIDEMRLSKHQRYTKMRAGNHSAETGTAQEACRREQLRYFFDGKTPPSNKSAATGGGGAPSSAISTVAAGAAGAPGAGAGARGLPESAPEGAGPAPRRAHPPLSRERARRVPTCPRVRHALCHCFSWSAQPLATSSVQPTPPDRGR